MIGDYPVKGESGKRILSFTIPTLVDGGNTNLQREMEVSIYHR